MSKGHGRYCEEGSCLCPVHGTPLWYWPKGDLHACQDRECEYAKEFDLDALRYKEMWESLDRNRRLRTLERASQVDIYRWSMPESQEVGGWWNLPQPDPLSEGWHQHEIRRQIEGRWFTYPPEEHTDDDQSDRQDEQDR